MKLFRKVFLLATVAACAVAGVAQVENAGGVRKRSERDKKSTPREGEVSQRMQDFYTAKEPHDADISYMREIYRQQQTSYRLILKFQPPLSGVRS